MNCLLKVYEEESQRGSFANRDELIISHLPLARYLVRRMAAHLPPHLDEEVLMSAAVMGLITSAERFEPARGVQFKTFAEQRIKGMIMDELRSQDWLSRSVRDKYKRLEREFTLLSQKLGREPESFEVAAAMGIDQDQYHRLLEEVHTFSFVSLNESWEDDEGSSMSLMDMVPDGNAVNPQMQMQSRELMDALGGSIDTLPEKERIVVTLYYYEELNLKEIGEVLGLTESRVSQLHSQAIVRLRSKMKGHGEEGTSGTRVARREMRR
jgi:RNA polymerase sigma factor for flagellar operon FliA